MHKAESQENVFIYWKLKHNISQPDVVIIIKDLIWRRRGWEPKKMNENKNKKWTKIYYLK